MNLVAFLTVLVFNSFGGATAVSSSLCPQHDHDSWLMSMQSNPPQFPHCFPPNCPPATSSDAGGVVYRFAMKNPVDAQDFLSHYELGLAPRSNPCRRCSLSVYRSLDSARKKLRELRDRSPDRFGSYIAEGSLTAAHGKIKQEGADPDHHEWWAYDGVIRHAPFRVVESLER